MRKSRKLLTVLVCCLALGATGCRGERKPKRAAFEKALALAIDSDPFVGALVYGQNEHDLQKVLSSEYTLQVQPKVGGGDVYVWTWNKEPLLSSLQVKAVDKGVFQAYMDLGHAGKAQFLVDIRNGAVERQV
jgi:hypothetical protein